MSGPIWVTSHDVRVTSRRHVTSYYNGICHMTSDDHEILEVEAAWRLAIHASILLNVKEEPSPLKRGCGVASCHTFKPPSLAWLELAADVYGLSKWPCEIWSPCVWQAPKTEYTFVFENPSLSFTKHSLSWQTLTSLLDSSDIGAT